jgi:predicted 2-oxoglutarate/Fe(II)-dependent dioxygenase YbiX
MTAVSWYSGDIRMETHDTAQDSYDGDIETKNSTETPAILTLFAIYHSLSKFANTRNRKQLTGG